MADGLAAGEFPCEVEGCCRTYHRARKAKLPLCDFHRRLHQAAASAERMRRTYARRKAAADSKPPG